MFFKKRFRYLFVSVLLLTFTTLLLTGIQAKASDNNGFVLLTYYNKELDIGDSLYLIAITSNGKSPTWSSSDSSVASVNSYGKVTAKKAGTATIYANTETGKATCKLTIRETTVTLSKTSLSLENGFSFRLTATTSNGSSVKWKSSNGTVAIVTKNGLVIARKPGEAVITATTDGTSADCSITVKTPLVQISDSKLTLFRSGTKQLTANSSSISMPKWKSNRKSVATVDANGLITAIKHGTAQITVTIDGVSKTCEVVVEQPEVTLSKSELILRTGESCLLTATVSSGNKPTWTSSNTNIVTVTSKGTIMAHTPGKAWIYASEDGVKACCQITVTE